MYHGGEEVIINSNSKINIIGPAGSGKSTTAKYLSEKYGLKRIELDSIFWKPNWVASTEVEFQKNVRSELVGQAGWIVDGGGDAVREVFWKDLNTVIWLDYSLPLISWRILKRTFLRVFITKEKMCGENQETFVDQYLSKKSIMYSTLKSFWSNKKSFSDLLNDPKSSHIKVYRVSTPKELSSLLEAAVF